MSTLDVTPEHREAHALRVLETVRQYERELALIPDAAAPSISDLGAEARDELDGLVDEMGPDARDPYFTLPPACWACGDTGSIQDNPRDPAAVSDCTACNLQNGGPA
ncbi:hypothetical protein [Nocardioides sp. AX2bis]|uniref:hypothetical protein n=1 Tax=Nocardioides sp. AX2bis TaxID=2653157 RepID=UPI0012EF62BB|nr:hypothetical protein [Nocardioides sp. AX2bis]VXB34042.1 hypothetical protein NOCARDAX2BIS_210083 [Nocardioides sp. AX2bis]